MEQEESVYHQSIYHLVASEPKDPICHSDECQIGSFSSEATIWIQPEAGKTTVRWQGSLHHLFIKGSYLPLYRLSDDVLAMMQ